MKSDPMNDVTRLVRAWNVGDRSVEQQLWPMVFGELKRLARRYMAQERPDHTLQSGALVSELYVRLQSTNLQWANRAQFLGVCARMMRQILVDLARARQCQKRGRGGTKLSLDDVALVSESKGSQLLALDDALWQLAGIDQRKSEVVELRFFGGLSVEETAELLKVSRLTVIRDWNFARAWLLSVMRGENIDEK